MGGRVTGEERRDRRGWRECIEGENKGGVRGEESCPTVISESRPL